MKRDQIRKAKKKPSSCSKREQPRFSKAMLKIAKENLKEFEVQSDEGFLVRADINRKLSSL